MLAHITATARAAGMTRLSLETGNSDQFAAANRLYERAGISPAEGLRRKEEGAADVAEAGDEAVLDAMIGNPVLIERPLVETEKGVRLCRPQDKVREIL